MATKHVFVIMLIVGVESFTVAIEIVQLPFALCEYKRRESAFGINEMLHFV